MERPANLSIHIIAFTAFSIACYFGATVLITVVLAILTAYLLDPLVNLLCRIRVPKSLSIGISMIIAGVLIGIVISLLFSRAQQFTDNFPKYRTKIQRVSNDITTRIRRIQKRSEDLSNTLLPSKPGAQPRTVRVERPSYFSDFLSGQVGHYLIQVSFFPFLVYFFLAEKAQIRRFISNQIRSGPAGPRDAADRLVYDLNSRINGFVVGYLWSTIILFVISWVVFLIFGVAEAVLWALVFALLNILPFVGAFLSAIPPIVIAILQFTSIQKTIFFVTVCIGLHLIYANWLIPRTTGPRTQLSPLAVLLAMMYWGLLWGPIGIFLAIPLTASLRTIWMEYRNLNRQERREALGGFPVDAPN